MSDYQNQILAGETLDNEGLAILKWENELDEGGAWPDLAWLTEHFNKAPRGAPSLPFVIEYMQVTG